MTTEVSTVIPLYTDSFYTYSVPLEGLVRQLTFRWVGFSKQWTMDIHDMDGSPVVTGIALVPNYNIMLNYNRPTFKGCFVLSASSPKMAARYREDQNIIPLYFTLTHYYDKKD